MKPDRDSGGTRPALALCPGKIGSAGNEGSAINVYFSHLEAMRADGQQPEQSPSHFLWTSVKHESKYVMSQKVARSPKANSIQSRAETEAAAERIHERFQRHQSGDSQGEGAEDFRRSGFTS